MRSCLTALFLFGVATGCHPFRAEVPEVKAGIGAYEQSKFKDAEKSFDSAIVRKPSPEAHFDDGAALARQHQLKDAEEQFGRALDSHDDALRARAYLDLGNAHGDANELDPAIEAYRRSLELDPTDTDARYNLEWALRQKDQQQNKKNGDGQPQANKDDKKNDDQKKDDKQQQAKNDPQKPGDQKQDQGKNDQPKPGDQPKQDQQQQQAKNDSAAQQKQDAQKKDQPQPQPGQQDEKQPADQNQQQQQAQAMNGQQQPKSDAPAPAQAKPMSQQDEQQVLDALQASEKNLQMWRFQAEPHRPRPGNEKDW